MMMFSKWYLLVMNSNYTNKNNEMLNEMKLKIIN